MENNFGFCPIFLELIYSTKSNRHEVGTGFEDMINLSFSMKKNIVP